MGGALNIGMRDLTGRVMVTESYTSCISAAFENVRFYEHDIFHFQKFFRDTPTTVVPDGYGLVFGDFITRTIYHCQGYSNLSGISSTCIAMDSQGMMLNGGDSDHSEIERFCNLYNKGYIRRLSESRKNDTVIKKIDTTMSAEDRIKLCNKNHLVGNHVCFREYLIEGGFDIIEYEETANGMTQFRDDLLEIGIKMTASDLRAWQDRIEDIAEAEAGDCDDDDVVTYRKTFRQEQHPDQREEDIRKAELPEGWITD